MNEKLRTLWQGLVGQFGRGQSIAQTLVGAVGGRWRDLSGRLRLPRGLRLPGGLRFWITCMSLGFVMAALLSHGRQLRQYPLEVQGWLWLLGGWAVVCSAWW